MEVKHILVLRSTSIANVVLRAFELFTDGFTPVLQHQRSIF